jgi:hypothetical protein
MMVYEYPPMGHGFPRSYSDTTPQEILYDHGKVLGACARIVDTGRTVLRQPRLETTLYRQELGMAYVVRGPQGEFYGRFSAIPLPSQLPPYAMVEREIDSPRVSISSGLGAPPHRPHRHGGRRGFRGGYGWGPWWPVPYVEEPVENRYVIVNPDGKPITVVRGIPRHVPKGWTFRVATASEAASGVPDNSERSMHGPFGGVDGVF